MFVTTSQQGSLIRDNTVEQMMVAKVMKDTLHTDAVYKAVKRHERNVLLGSSSTNQQLIERLNQEGTPCYFEFIVLPISQFPEFISIQNVS